MNTNSLPATVGTKDKWSQEINDSIYFQRDYRPVAGNRQVCRLLKYNLIASSIDAN